MTPHPDLAGLDVPERATLGPFRLTMLTAGDLVADFAAVTGSASVLRGLFGPDWPDGLTQEADLTDLHWHHREFIARRSFAWVIRDADETYLGCAYMFPDIGMSGRGEAVFWFTDTRDRAALCTDFGSLYSAWWKDLLPPPYAMNVRSNAPDQGVQAPIDAGQGILPWPEDAGDEEVSPEAAT